ncbi:MAG: AmmeMemoRadiSam system radical SAM enzyme [Candidatus Omnitrophica bacterium]|nr:AmmeMemoRadiSam system radical SAM enzyme [Candidatus Omnitrophota bacterium]
MDNPAAQFWKSTKKDKVTCYLCPRGCILTEGKSGFCWTRKNVQGNMVLTTYGQASGFCVDPIEKKPLYHFYPGTSVFSFGTTGCNLACKFCQNWHMQTPEAIEKITNQKQKASPEQIAQTAKELGCHSVAFTYNEPITFAEFAMDVAKACRNIGIKTVAVTAGYITEEPRKDFFKYMDAANVDLKAFTEEFYHKLTSTSLKPVLETLKYLAKETNVWLEITNLIIPGENDDESEIHQMTEWIAKELRLDIPLHFSAFHPAFKMLDHQATPVQTLLKARQIALSKGLRYVYAGNIVDAESSTTFCHHCKELLIERYGFEITTYKLKDKNKCPKCQTVCAGQFSDKPGEWGSKRLPVSL